MMQIELSKIAFDEGTQARARLDDTTVAAYAELMTEGGTLPPVTVFFDGSAYWLADGYHRVFAHRKIGALKIDADVKTGGRRDAVLYAVGANATHGLPRTAADKRKAVATLLADDEWSQWSDREIARRCSVGPHLVAKVRASLCAAHSDESGGSLCAAHSDDGSAQQKPQRTRSYTTKHGTKAEMKVDGIAEAAGERATARDKSHEQPGAAEELSTLRELAAEQTTMLEEAQAEIESLSKIVDAGDQMAEARRQISQLQAEVRTLRERQQGLMGELAEAKRIAKSLRAKLEKLERGGA